MRFKPLLLASVISLMALPAFAEMQGEKEHGWQPPKSRAEAISRKKEQLAKLEKMTDKEWQEREEKFKSRREAWKKMTPEEREKARAEWKKDHSPAGTAPAR